MTIVLCDQRTDSGFQQLHSLNSLFGLPDFVKSADWHDACVPPEEHPKYYADIRHPYQFPVHSPEATMLSQMYFSKNAAKINSKVRPTIQARLDKFADFWGISDASSAFKTKFAEANGPLAIPDDDFALVRVVDGQEDRRYPLRNALEVKTAAVWMRTNIGALRQDYSVGDRMQMAERILQKAAQHGADIDEETSDFLEVQAGQGTCSPPQAAALIRQRYKLARKVAPELKTLMEKLAEHVGGSPSCFFGGDMSKQVRETIESFDRAHNIQYTEGTPSPEELLCSLTYRKVANFKDTTCELVTGSVYDSNAFADLPLGAIADVFGQEVADEVSGGLNPDPVKMAEIAATFPRPDARRLEELLSGNNIFPLLKNARNTGWSVPAAEL